MRVALQSLVLCAALAPHAFAGVIVVAAAGGGNFTDLPAAVAAASDGDILLVKGGLYTAPTISNKSLDLVADLGAPVVVSGGTVVTGLGATRCVTLSGLTLRGPSSLAPALTLSTCTGSIRVQGCTLQGFDQPDCVPGNPPPDAGTALSVASCDDVCLARCTVNGGNSGNFADAGGNAGHAIAASGSRLALYENEVRGGRAGDVSALCGGVGAYGYGGDGGHGVLATSCPVLFASGCVLAGGDASSGWTNSDPCPGVGVRLLGALFTRLDCTITAGSVPPSNIGACPCYTPICGAPTQTLNGAARRLTATRVAREGGVVRIDVFGTTGDEVELVFADRARFQFPAAHTGVNLVRPSHPSPVRQSGTIGPSGQLTLSWIVGDLGPGVLGWRVFAQATHREPAGRVLVGPPATIVLLDSSL